eukprot:TRINITY_DN6360_c0_g1_i1.p1 TRINITY_DN6360_c0_g1~~TRINITY_DN6360_c0_g1_i1.p1  ORF type:complete len:338 (-),score=144.90 TRINITY_DN6360_c0_g1_i1:238-1251(-)
MNRLPNRLGVPWNRLFSRPPISLRPNRNDVVNYCWFSKRYISLSASDQAAAQTPPPPAPPAASPLVPAAVASAQRLSAVPNEPMVAFMNEELHAHNYYIDTIRAFLKQRNFELSTTADATTLTHRRPDGEVVQVVFDHPDLDEWLSEPRQRPGESLTAMRSRVERQQAILDELQKEFESEEDMDGDEDGGDYGGDDEPGNGLPFMVIVSKPPRAERLAFSMLFDSEHDLEIVELVAQPSNVSQTQLSATMRNQLDDYLRERGIDRDFCLQAQKMLAGGFASHDQYDRWLRNMRDFFEPADADRPPSDAPTHDADAADSSERYENTVLPRLLRKPAGS